MQSCNFRFSVSWCPKRFSEFGRHGLYLEHRSNLIYCITIGTIRNMNNISNNSSTVHFTVTNKYCKSFIFIELVASVDHNTYSAKWRTFCGSPLTNQTECEERMRFATRKCSGQPRAIPLENAVTRSHMGNPRNHYIVCEPPNAEKQLATLPPGSYGINFGATPRWFVYNLVLQIEKYSRGTKERGRVWEVKEPPHTEKLIRKPIHTLLLDTHQLFIPSNAFAT